MWPTVWQWLYMCAHPQCENGCTCVHTHSVTMAVRVCTPTVWQWLHVCAHPQCDNGWTCVHTHSVTMTVRVCTPTVWQWLHVCAHPQCDNGCTCVHTHSVTMAARVYTDCASIYLYFHHLVQRQIFIQYSILKISITLSKYCGFFIFKW
jgi:hypothetical protein